MVQIPPWSMLLIAMGLPFVIWPDQITKLYELFDAIGRRSSGPVEPADWYVTLVRIGGGIFLVIGIVGILRPVL